MFNEENETCFHSIIGRFGKNFCRKENRKKQKLNSKIKFKSLVFVFFCKSFYSTSGVFYLNNWAKNFQKAFFNGFSFYSKIALLL